MGIRRFGAVDALRGIAAMGVVLFHAREGRHIDALLGALPAWVSEVFDAGRYGVPVFFVLSGFVIAHSLRGIMSAKELGRFTLRRSLRLDPPYWASIVALLVYGWVSAAIGLGAAPAHSAGEIAAHLLYLQDILGYPELSPVFWTLCLEIQFYLVFAVLLLAAGRFRNVCLAVACAASLAWPLGIGPVVPSGLFPPLWHGFLVGAASYVAWREGKAAVPFFLAFAALLIVAGAMRQEWFSITSAGTALLLFGLAVSNRIETAMSWHWLQFLGMVSYSLYLMHNMASGAIFRFGKIISGDGVVAQFTWLLLAVGGSVAVAAVFWWLIERPTMLLSRRVRQVHSTIAVLQAPPPP